MENINGTRHVSVMIDEVMTGLNLMVGQHAIDSTFGGGGHSQAILTRILPGGKLLAFDWDEEAIRRAEKHFARFRSDITFVQDSFIHLKKYVLEKNFYPVSAILADFGFSSDQMEDASRGFSIQRKGPLDMRYSKKNPLTAEYMVRTYSESELTRIFQEYGEEKHSRLIAQNIVKYRKLSPITTTEDLKNIFEKVPALRRRGKIHPATRVFQALRIAVNQELNNIPIFLEQAIDVLAPKGRLAVLTFHSLEDRIVKQFFRKESQGCVCGAEPLCVCRHGARIKIINKKVIRPKREEMLANPRSRSAKMRVVEKI